MFLVNENISISLDRPISSNRDCCYYKHNTRWKPVRFEGAIAYLGDSYSQTN